MYVLKGVNLGLAFASFYLTEKLFSEIYMKQVYALQEDPPSLHKFLGLFLLIHSGFNLFLLTLMMLLLFMFKKPTNNFIVSWYLIQTYLLDHFMISIILVIVASLIASIMQKKRYFRYRTEGLRAIRGYKEICQYSSILMFLIPFFYFFM
jgi:hypothetical protein